MKRDVFLKVALVIMATPLILPLDDIAQTIHLKNWAGNLTYSTDKVAYPDSVGQVQEIVKNSLRIKALGTRHCFNNIADSRYQLLSTSKLNKIISLDREAMTVTVEAGIKYGELAPWLDAQGYALHNLASLPHISVGGSISTATHGSGVRNKNLSAAVAGLELVLADGSLLQLTRERSADTLHAVSVGLGAAGIITQVTLDIEPAYIMRQHVYLKLPMTTLAANFDRVVSAAYSVSLFTDWQSDAINEVWIKSRTEDALPVPGDEFYGAQPAIRNLHPILAHSAENCTEQLGVAGPWYERLPHFKMGFTPSSGAELQSEYFIPHTHAVEAIQAIHRLGNQIGPYLLISEIRTIAADELWMSPCYHQDSVTIHFTWKPDWEGVQSVLPLIEKALAPFQPRPHWGKVFILEPVVLQSRYEKLDDFKKLIAGYDPERKFQNDFLARNL